MAPLARAAPSAEEMTNQAKWCREQAREVLGNYESLVGAYSYHIDFTRDDLRLAKPAYDEQSARWVKSALAFEKGDADAGKSLREQAEKGAQIINRWRDRLDARQHEAELAPREGAYYDFYSRSTAGAKGALTALYDVQSAAAEAWCTLAENITPAADAEGIEDLRDKAQAASDEVDLARSNWEAINRREALAGNGFMTDHLKQELDQMRQLDEQRQQTKRRQLEMARQVRQLERQSLKLEAQVHKDLDAAKREKGK